MRGIKGYSKSSPTGGVIVDTEGMLVDLITVVKAVGTPKADFMTWVEATWDLVEVRVDTSNVRKDA